MTAATRILLIDDHGLFRESLVRLLESEHDLHVVAHCAAISEALAVLDRHSIHVILLDYDLGDERGSDLLRELRTRGNPARVLMVTAGMSERITRDVLNDGVAGIILKHNDPEQLIDAIRKVAAGEMWVEGQILRSLLSTPAQPADVRTRRPLTERQKEVLAGILEGLRNKEIAWNLKVSESSVKAVIQELFQKAGVRTRSQLVRIAIERHTDDWLNQTNTN
ncbi:MAG TPA: response regulator transcription factor [Acidobacteriaceae bacterium]|jgi:DNA-binding NarL/FixJ family response regulator|nr:response regulator transcription factor [Acidobacteriaceae bacterium]